MTFSDQYIQTLQRVYDLTKNGQVETIETDFSITKMLGAWSSIFWALPHFDQFNDFSVDQLKELVKALIKGHINYGKTTNQYLRTETIDWIAGTFKIKVSVNSSDKNERLYAEQWIIKLYSNSDTAYSYNSELGQTLKQQQDEYEIQRQQIEKEKAERLDLIEQENAKRQAEKQKLFFEHLDRNQTQKEIREKFLEGFSKQTLTEQLRTITSNTNPLHYFPTNIANVPNEILNELTSEERNTLYEMIKKYRIKDWYETRDRIQRMDKKYHS